MIRVEPDYARFLTSLWRVWAESSEEGEKMISFGGGDYIQVVL